VIAVPHAGWNVEIQFEEDESLTSAASLLQLPEGTELQGRGQARRNPADPAQPQIGEEIAAARALSDLVHQLLDKAAAEIEDVTHKPAHLTG
jgi:Rv2632c-like